nr:putative ribonuclease H-like domain-containing protein [Tanacetum cinerariifolium]
MYYLVIIDDYSMFSWIFFLAKKDETCGILKDFITGIENQLNHKVKIIRCDNGTKFKNYEMNQLCRIKGIKMELSNARTPQQNEVAERKNKTLIEAARTMTPQQNEVAERKNKTLIEAARTMLVDSRLPIPFWAEAVNTACYVQNRVLVTKPHNKTPYELLVGRAPIISFMRPFSCPVTILNTLDHLGKFDGKADEGFLVGYSINRKAFRVYNSITKKVEENLHVNFLENKPNVAGSGNRSNGIAGSKIHFDVGQERKKKVSDQEYILLPLLNTCLDVPSCNEGVESSPKDNAGKNPIVNTASDKDGTFQRTYGEWNFSTPIPVNVASSSFSHLPALDDFSKMPDLEDTGIFDDTYDDRDEGEETDYNKLETIIPVSCIPSTRIHKDHPKEQIIREVNSAIQIRKMAKQNKAELITFVNKQRRTNHKDFQIVYLLVFSLKWNQRRKEPWELNGSTETRKIIEGLLIKAIRLFFADASFMDITVYQMDVKSALLYGTIKEEVYVSQPPGFVNPQFPDKVYKVEKALYGVHQDPRAWYETLSYYLLEN